MNAVSPESKEQRVVKTRSKTLKKEIKSDDAIPVLKKTKRTFKMKRQNRKGGAIIYIGHIPHGFYEDEMKSYFNQFGKVLATVVARSKKTGRSKGYGFVEFKDEEVAKIAAETMNNYLMFNRILKCRYIPPEENRGRLNERKITADDFPRQRNRRINKMQKQKALSSLSQSMYLEKVEAKINKFKEFFKEKGVDFTFQIKCRDNSVMGSEEKTTSTIGSEFETKDDPNDEFGVLEIDESENEIYFKTPPQVKKVFKKSFTSSATPAKECINSNNLQAGKEKLKLLKKSSLKKTKIKEQKSKHKTKVGVRQKLNKTEKIQKTGVKKLKVKEFLEEDIPATAKQRKAKAKVNPVRAKKRKISVTETHDSKLPKSGKNKILISVKAQN